MLYTIYLYNNTQITAGYMTRIKDKFLYAKYVNKSSRGLFFTGIYSIHKE